MQSREIRKALLAAMATIGVGLSASGYAAGSSGSGTSGSTGGFVQRNEARDGVAAAPSASVAQIQDASGGGAHNPVDDEGHRVNRTWVYNADTQLASGIGARNYVERDSDRFDTVRAEQAARTRLAEHHE
jgi:hypothetical protein